MGHGEQTWNDGKWHVGDKMTIKWTEDGCSGY